MAVCYNNIERLIFLATKGNRKESQYELGILFIWGGYEIEDVTFVSRDLYHEIARWRSDIIKYFDIVGNNVHRDIDIGIQMITKSANQEYAKAQRMLIKIYAGVPLWELRSLPYGHKEGVYDRNFFNKHKYIYWFRRLKNNKFADKNYFIPGKSIAKTIFEEIKRMIASGNIEDIKYAEYILQSSTENNINLEASLRMMCKMQLNALVAPCLPD